jgi:2-haloacid dehalogenase
MAFNRRGFLSLAIGALAGNLTGWQPAWAARTRGVEAIALDAFTTFDARPVFALADRLFPGHGAELGSIWRTRQFEYQWLRAAAGHYADFWQATEGGLVFAAKQLKLDLTADKREQLMGAYLEIKAWPDSAPALRILRSSGLRLALLSNATPPLLDTWIGNADLGGVFEHVLSTDSIRTYKPDPRAYQLGPDAFGLMRDRIAFAAFGGWDAAGAKWFGYPTFWVNRMSQPVEELGVVPDGIGSTLTDLVSFIGA